jgi:hypothetical protein
MTTLTTPRKRTDLFTPSVSHNLFTENEEWIIGREIALPDGIEAREDYAAVYISLVFDNCTHTEMVTVYKNTMTSRPRPAEINWCSCGSKSPAFVAKMVEAMQVAQQIAAEIDRIK